MTSAKRLNLPAGLFNSMARVMATKLYPDRAPALRNVFPNADHAFRLITMRRRAMKIPNTPDTSVVHTT